MRVEAAEVEDGGVDGDHLPDVNKSTLLLLHCLLLLPNTLIFVQITRLDFNLLLALL